MEAGEEQSLRIGGFSSGRQQGTFILTALIELDRVPDSEPHHPHLHSRERHLPVLMRVKEQGTRTEITEMKHLGTAKMNKEFLLTPRIPCHRSDPEEKIPEYNKQQEKEKRSSATRRYQNRGPKLPKRRREAPGVHSHALQNPPCTEPQKGRGGGWRLALRRGRGARGGGVAPAVAPRSRRGALWLSAHSPVRGRLARSEPIPGLRAWPAWPGPRPAP
uniref:Uncharacterized protein n=1 Tax=Rangifer tarandus platyrhynchus TaxID=3082113 RepID=A0ACB0FL22_RANTA|nr:unnamed protein product [Rangifer tarandus platyrhynchus]